MNICKILIYILSMCLLIWILQILFLLFYNYNTPHRIIAKEANEQQLLLVAHMESMRDLENEYAARTYLASGETVFERIYNTQEQPITELITKLAEEALPDDWSASIKVEEFIHFILLIYLPHSMDDFVIDSIISAFLPVILHSEGALSNVAVFDHRHKSFLFFDKTMLDYISERKTLTADMLKIVNTKGEEFNRFNSITVHAEKHESHFMLPMEITGSRGTDSIYALLDSGASTTMLSEEIIRKTGNEDLSRVPHRTFQTVKGKITCPIVTRVINIGGIVKTIDVAVNRMDELNLIGMNFFEGMDYIIESAQAAVHMWNK